MRGNVGLTTELLMNLPSTICMWLAALDTGPNAFQHLQERYLTKVVGYHRWWHARSR
jgi:hypothetical protein